MSAPPPLPRGPCCYWCRRWIADDWREVSGKCWRPIKIDKRPFWFAAPPAEGSVTTIPTDGTACEGYASGRPTYPMLRDSAAYCLGLRKGYRIWLIPSGRRIDPAQHRLPAVVLKVTLRAATLATPAGQFSMRLIHRPDKRLYAGTLPFLPWMVLDTSVPPTYDERTGMDNRNITRYLSKRRVGDTVPLLAWGELAGERWTGKILSRRRNIITIQLPGGLSARVIASGEYAGTPVSAWDIHDGTVWAIDKKRAR